MSADFSVPPTYPPYQSSGCFKLTGAPDLMSILGSSTGPKRLKIERGLVVLYQTTSIAGATFPRVSGRTLLHHPSIPHTMLRGTYQSQGEGRHQRWTNKVRGDMTCT